MIFFIIRQGGLFPDEDTPNRLFDGIRFADLPICNIKASPNNTIMTICTAQGKSSVCSHFVIL